MSASETVLIIGHFSNVYVGVKRGMITIYIARMTFDIGKAYAIDPADFSISTNEKTMEETWYYEGASQQAGSNSRCIDEDRPVSVFRRSVLGKSRVIPHTPYTEVPLTEILDWYDEVTSHLSLVPLPKAAVQEGKGRIDYEVTEPVRGVFIGNCKIKKVANSKCGPWYTIIFWNDVIYEEGSFFVHELGDRYTPAKTAAEKAMIEPLTTPIGKEVGCVLRYNVTQTPSRTDPEKKYLNVNIDSIVTLGGLCQTTMEFSDKEMLVELDKVTLAHLTALRDYTKSAGTSWQKHYFIFFPDEKRGEMKDEEEYTRKGENGQPVTGTKVLVSDTSGNKIEIMGADKYSGILVNLWQDFFYYEAPWSNVFKANIEGADVQDTPVPEPLAPEPPLRKEVIRTMRMQK